MWGNKKKKIKLIPAADTICDLLYDITNKYRCRNVNK